MPLPSVWRMAIKAKHYPFQQRERAVKMVLDHLDEYRSVYAACVAIGPKVGVGVESLRRWVLQAQVDDSARSRHHNCRTTSYP
jgi:transposase